MATFKNPNDPPQPQPGVYGWFITTGSAVRCLYVGNAGARQSARRKGTLLRGVTELQREFFSTDSNRQRLDTDFVVGTAIRYFERQGHTVYWEHLSNEPADEKCLHAELKPLLQKATAPQLHANLKIPRTEPYYWRWPGRDLAACRRKLEEAEILVFAELDQLMAHDR